MLRYFIKRFIAMIMTVLVITTLTFVMMKVIPGSPFNEERGTNEAVQRNLESYYHLNEPLITQYAIYLKSILTFDFGPSIKKPSDSVNAMLERGFPVSFELGITAIIIAVISGLALGIMAALRRGGFLDYAAMSLAVLGISIPNFIMATLLIQQFAVHLKWFPAATWTSPVHMVRADCCACRRSHGHYREADKIKHVRSADSGLHPHGKSKGAFSRQNCDQTRIKKRSYACCDSTRDACRKYFNGQFRHRENFCHTGNGQIFRRKHQSA